MSARMRPTVFVLTSPIRALPYTNFLFLLLCLCEHYASTCCLALLCSDTMPAATASSGAGDPMPDHAHDLGMRGEAMAVDDQKCAVSLSTTAANALRQEDGARRETGN